jgi:hypothetical protein
MQWCRHQEGHIWQFYLYHCRKLMSKVRERMSPHVKEPDFDCTYMTTLLALQLSQRNRCAKYGVKGVQAGHNRSISNWFIYNLPPSRDSGCPGVICDLLLSFTTRV